MTAAATSSGSLPDATRPFAAVLGVSRDGVVVHASDDVAAVLGWDPADIVGGPLTTLIPDRLRSAHHRAFDRWVATGHLMLAGERLELLALTPDGSEVEIELVLSPAGPDDEAAVIGMIRRPSESDPTRSELLESLRRTLSEERDLATLLEQCLALVGGSLGWRRGVMWAVDPSIDRLRARAFWRADGHVDAEGVRLRERRLRRGEEAPGRVWASGVTERTDGPPDEGDGATSSNRLSFPLYDGSDVVGVVELADGESGDLSSEGAEAVRLVGRELGRLLADRFRHDAAEAERQRLYLALSSYGMGVWTYRVIAGDLVWDDRVEEMHGFEPGTFTGRIEDFVEIVHPEDRDEFRTIVVEAVATSDRFDYRYRIEAPDGSERWIGGSGVPLLDFDGEVREIIGVSYDITREVEDRAELVERARHAALAADVGRALVGQASIDERLQRCTEAVVAHLDAAFARVWVLPPGSDLLELRASAGQYTHLDGAHSRVRVGELKIGLIASELEAHLTTQVVGDPRVSDQEWARREGMRSFAGYPLVVGERCVGVLALFARRVLPTSILSALGSIADTVAIGIEQARAEGEIRRLLDEERARRAELAVALSERSRVATVLQESLLPPTLPEIDGLALAARYRAGVDEVGGDFYDVFPTGAGTWGLLIGDICGKGPDAARLTALARHSLRTAMTLGVGPAGALDALNGLLLSSDNDSRFCSAVCGTVTIDDGGVTVELGVAGHPPPLIIEPGADPVAVAPTGPLVGLFGDAEFGQRTIELSPGRTLLLYTDGVIEARRGSDLFGLIRLERVLAANAAAPIDRLVGEVVDRVSEFDSADGQDDLAVLAVRPI